MKIQNLLLHIGEKFIVESVVLEDKLVLPQHYVLFISVLWMFFRVEWTFSWLIFSDKYIWFMVLTLLFEFFYFFIFLVKNKRDKHCLIIVKL